MILPFFSVSGSTFSLLTENHLKSLHFHVFFGRESNFFHIYTIAGTRYLPGSKYLPGSQTTSSTKAEKRRCPPPQRKTSPQFSQKSYMFSTIISGNSTRISVPFPTSLSMVIFAPCWETICFTIASPRPVPPVALERLLSTR